MPHALSTPPQKEAPQELVPQTEDQLEQDATLVPGFQRVTLRLELHSLDVLMDVMTTVARVGAQIETVVAEGQRMVIGYVARNAVAQRLPGLLQELIYVLHVERLKQV
ncbi:MAG: hypothetical protein ACR2NZ_19680 [Rubripirellula sp.]